MSQILQTKSKQFQEKIKTAPLLPGCYIYLNNKGKVLYVGKAKRLRNRVKSYFSNYPRLEIKIQNMIEQACDIQYYTVDSEVEALILEVNLIKKYNPKYNSMMTDDKNYIWVKFENPRSTRFPQILTVRKKDDDRAEYFGPYPNTMPARNILKRMRKVFPYFNDRHVLIETEDGEQRFKPCFYFHIGMCPCGFDLKKAREEHMKSFNNIRAFFRGEKVRIMQELEKRMLEESKNMNFEEAARIRDRINDIRYITARIKITTNIDDVYIEQIKKQQKENAINQLIEFLNFPKDKLFNHKDFRIECYDISNIQGTNAVGSMVVMIDGVIKPEFYRRFKIRFGENEPNDFLMHQEVLARRFRNYILNNAEAQLENKNSEQSGIQEINFDQLGVQKFLYKKLKTLKEDESFKQRPDLIIIDGGKGQLSCTYQVLQEFGLENKIPIVGLAKREEEIFKIREQFSKEKLKLFENTFERVKLPRRSESLFLVQRIRDEAHRFAITYHRHLRSKEMTKI
jgi:excinuclease ABC subunit C